ncbi:hypothetical protein CGK66_16710 [Vibrio parahaemolyticus]|uniref:hypothetical protein n=3 Tax=Vibrio parahaemolyticus TaxID=670 RepID=UPI0001BC7255|nr:hypothetical protein [Vibrio parahaemolyticus]EFO46500.1 hypothetical protein VIPARAQ4037_A0756 [Vibrio parahaemolyticus AQ4037]TNY55122.1 hypothetical protein CGK66_16710 [Vibrio parahaemolyticus]TNY88609.1 hypothetical protein CGK59_13640 [Vibrio parahaemolyticus]
MGLYKQHILGLLFLLPSMTLARQLPFGFDSGTTQFKIPYPVVEVQNLTDYCPIASSQLVGKSIPFAKRESIMDFTSVDFDRLRTSEEIDRFNEVPSGFYRNAKEHLVNFYKKSKKYEFDIKLATAFSSSDTFKQALAEIPDDIYQYQKVFDVNGTLVCGEFINDELWSISFTPESTKKFYLISADIKEKYNKKGLLTKWYADCDLFKFSSKDECVLVSNSVNLQQGMSVSYLLKAPEQKGFGIYDQEERQYDGLPISRESNEIIRYADWDLERNHWDSNKAAWHSFISRYTKPIRTIYEQEILKHNDSVKEFLDQF